MSSSENRYPLFRDMRSTSKLALGRGNFARASRIDRNRRPQRARQPLEAGLGDVVVVVAVKRLHMQRNSGIHRKGLEPLAHQLGVEFPDLVAPEGRLEDQEGAAGN